MKHPLQSAAAVLIAVAGSASAGTLTGPTPFIDELTSGIDPAKFYTHVIDFGSGASARPVVNGITFNTVTDAGLTQIGRYGVDNNQPNNGAQNTGTSVTSGTGLDFMLRDLKWNQNNPGTLQLTGLEPGAMYDFRLYQRQWSSNTRTHNITFDDGSGAPSVVNFNPDADPATAQYFSYTYMAPASGVVDVSWVGDNVPPNTTFHLYGATNELVADGTWLHARAASDNHFAIYLGAADGSNLRLVGRDRFGDWRDSELYAMLYQPGDHIYLMSWDNPGAIMDPQMVIGEFETPGGGMLVTNGTDWEVVEGPSGANPGNTLDEASLPAIGDVETLIAGATWAAPGAVAPNTTGPWGTNGEFSPQWSGAGSAAEFIWGDTFDNVSLSNTNETYYLFRTLAPVLTGIAFSLDETSFSSGVGMGDLVGTFAFVSSDPDDVVTYALVAGDGDADNGKFQIVDDRLEGGNFDFSGEDDGEQYSIRVEATGTETGAFQMTFMLTLLADSEPDMLPDSWELAFAENLDTLDGRNGADFDMDDLTDLEEFQMNPNAIQAPNGLDPTNPDSDDDMSNDGAEIAANTIPTDPDTDDDDLKDGIDPNPLNKDTDGDGWRDGLEVLLFSDPEDANSVPEFDPGVTVSPPIKDDCSSGITDMVEYTHKISGGTAATVNGVAFDLMTDQLEPAGMVWTASGGKNIIANNNGDWNPAAGGVTGQDMRSLMAGFTYSGGGAEPGSTQNFTLSGLTAGNTYDLRLYIRVWDTEGSGRPIDLSFTNGADVVVASPDGGAPEDRPSLVLMDGNDHQAYFVNFRYTAQGSEVQIDANVPATAPPGSGSFHMYALTNEVAVAGSPLQPRILDIVYEPDHPEGARATITAILTPGIEHFLEVSTTLTPFDAPGGWSEVSDGIFATAGVPTVVVDTIGVQGSPDILFYRFAVPEE